MIIEYFDDVYGMSAYEQLNKDIKENPHLDFEVIGYQRLACSKFVRFQSSILVDWKG